MLSTKVRVPPLRSQLVRRPGVIKNFQACLDANLLLVSAPAGFGKTTALVQWLQENRNLRAAWFSIEKLDNDPARFWEYFIAAVRIVHPGFGGEVIPKPSSSPQASMELFLVALVNEFVSFKDDLFVILDDYHLIDNQSIHDGLSYLLDQAPANFHLVLSTRADPPLPLAHLRGRGSMIEIGTDDLRFNPEDAASLLEQSDISGLSSDDVFTLNNHVEGWAVGLKMVSLSMKGRQDNPEFIKAFSGSNRYVMDYLLEEVIQKQPGESWEFLYKTSILTRLTGPLCDAVTGTANGRSRLLQMERDHVFIVPLDEERKWYRYEHLFSDLLQHKLRERYDEQEIVDMHRNASTWYEVHGLPGDAIYHALAGNDWETSMRLIYESSEEFRKQGRFETLLNWLKTIPEQTLRTHHRLYSLYASFLTSFSEFDAAEAALTYLTDAARDDNEILSEATFSLSNIARMRGDYARSIALGENALITLPPANVVMRARTNWNIGYAAYLWGHFREAEPRLTEAFKLGQQGEEFTAAGAAMMILGIMAVQSGSLHRAIRLATPSLGFSQSTAGFGYFALRLAYYELNDLEHAADYAQRAIAATDSMGGPAEGNIASYFILARVNLARGDKDGLLKALAGMDKAQLHPTVSQASKASYFACRTLLAIQNGDLETASEWGSELEQNHHDFLSLQYQHVPARLLTARGNKEEAAAILRTVYERLMQENAYGLAIGVRICQALAAENEAVASEFMSGALRMGESRGYVRTFVDEGTYILPLLKRSLDIGITPNYIEKLIDIIESEIERKRALSDEGKSFSAEPPVLSARELEVLHLLANGFSNEQIARELVISPATVKNHVHHILDKLEARGRTHAVTIARELNLI